jgi:chemotaxis protein MotB
MRSFSNGFKKIIGLGVVGVLCAGVLGGCSNNKTELDAAKTENTELRTQNESLSAQIRDRDARIADLQNQVATATKPAPTEIGGGGGGRQTQNEVFVLAGDVTFASGQATLTSGAKKELDGIARQLKSKYSGASIRVEGYTDSTPIKKSKFGSNEALSQARAESVEKYLVSKGISSGNISAVGMGSAKPKKDAKSSRRVEIHVGN